MYYAIPEPKYNTCSLFLGLLEPEWEKKKSVLALIKAREV